MQAINWWTNLKERIAFPLVKPQVPEKESFEVMRGFFVASKIRWKEIQKALVDPANYQGTDSNNSLIRTQNQAAIYPIKKFMKVFETSIPIEGSISLDANSISGKQIKTYVSHYLEKNKALSYNSEKLIDWLKKKTCQTAFFYFVEFKIDCVIDINTFQTTNPNKPPKDKEADVENLIIENFDWIAEQVYLDFYEACNEEQKYSIITAETQMQETTKNETKTGTTSKVEEQTDVTSISKQSISSFSYYLLKNVESPEVKPESFSNLSFRLGEKIALTAKITEEIERSKTETKLVPKPELTINLAKISSQNKLADALVSDSNLRYRLILESDYFSFTPKISQLDTQTECKVEISPEIEKLTAEDKKDEGYTVKIQLIDTKYNVFYLQKQIKIKLDYPVLEIKLNRPNLPHKGWPIDLEFIVKASNIDSEIPISLKGKLGPDFFVVNPPAFDETKKGEITYTFAIKSDKKEDKKLFTVKAARAGHWPWFRNEAYFNFSIGKWNLPVKQKEFSVGTKTFGKLKNSNFWKMRMNVYPSWFDTLIAGFAGIYLLLTWYYPEWAIPITANLNLATLALPSSAIYLIYRLVNWGRTLQSESKEKE